MRAEFAILFIQIHSLQHQITIAYYDEKSLILRAFCYIMHKLYVTRWLIFCLKIGAALL